MSSGCMIYPIDAASSGPRPSYTLFKSYPRMAVLATSDPGRKPSGMVLSLPVLPILANMFMYGVSAYCSSVLFPNLSTAWSAIPSPSMIICFIILNVSYRHNICEYSSCSHASSCAITLN